MSKNLVAILKYVSDFKDLVWERMETYLINNFYVDSMLKWKHLGYTEFKRIY